MARVKQNESPIQPGMLQPDASWEPYRDLRDVCVNGRPVGEEQAYRETREIFEIDDIRHNLSDK